MQVTASADDIGSEDLQLICQIGQVCQFRCGGCYRLRVECIELQRLRDEWSDFVDLAAADEAFEVSYRGTGVMVLLSPATWQLGAKKVPVQPELIAEVSIAEGRERLSERRIAARRNGEHTRVLWGHTGEPQAMLVPIAWAREALAVLFSEPAADT